MTKGPRHLVTLIEVWWRAFSSLWIYGSLRGQICRIQKLPKHCPWWRIMLSCCTHTCHALPAAFTLLYAHLARLLSLALSLRVTITKWAAFINRPSFDFFFFFLLANILRIFYWNLWKREMELLKKCGIKVVFM